MMMRTTLTLDDDVAADIEKTRRVRGGSFKSVVNEALRRGLDELARPRPRRPAFRMRTFDVGAVLIPNMDCIGEVLAQIEGEDFR